MDERLSGGMYAAVERSRGHAALRWLGHGSWVLAALAIATNVTAALSSMMLAKVPAGLLAVLGFGVLFVYFLAFICGMLAIVLGLVRGIGAGRAPAIVGMLLSLGAGGFMLARGVKSAVEGVSREEKLFVSDDGLSQVRLQGGGWTDSLELNEEANLQVAWPIRELYLMVFSTPRSELDPALTLNDYLKYQIDSMADQTLGERIGDPETVTIDGVPGVQQEISGKFDGIELVYRVAVVQTHRHLHEILAWTLPSRVAEPSEELQRTIQSVEFTIVAKEPIQDARAVEVPGACRAGAATFLCMRSMEGRFEDKTWYYTEADGQLSVRRRDVDVEAVFQGEDGWDFDLGPPMDELLTAGFYGGITSEYGPRPDPETGEDLGRRPLLRVRIPRATCSGKAGWFEIHILELGPENRVERLAFDFEILCGGNLGTLKGRYCFECPRRLRDPSAVELRLSELSQADHLAMLNEASSPGPKIDFESLDEYCATDAATFLCTFSERIDNGGWTSFGPITDGRVSRERPKSRDGVGFRFAEADHYRRWMSLYFNPPPGEELAEGTYTVDWTDSGRLSSPGLFIAGSTHCSRVRGRFHVFESGRDPETGKKSFGVDFEQYCRSTEHAALIGRFCQNCGPRAAFGAG